MSGCCIFRHRPFFFIKIFCYEKCSQAVGTFNTLHTCGPADLLTSLFAFTFTSMRYNLSLIVAAAALLPSSSSSSSQTTPLASIAAASKRVAFITKQPNDDALIGTTTTSTCAQDIVDLASGGAVTESQPLSQEPALDAVADAPLISDIEMLSSMLAEVVKKENPIVFDYYTRLRTLGMNRAANPDDVQSFEEMKKLAYDVSPGDCKGVMKTFSIALNLVNAAEVHHRMRLVRVNEEQSANENVNVGPLPMVEDSIRGTMEILLENDGVDPGKQNNL